jgi:phospholipid/cholesterol/gamma-HCH transport system ATP-binding protein
MRRASLADFGLPVELVEPHEPVVLFDKVCLSFDDKVILKDVTFDVRAGHTKIFLGASGPEVDRLKLMLGSQTRSGTIWVLGHGSHHNERALMGVRHHMGMMSRKALFDSFTVGERRLQALRGRLPLEEVRQRVEEVLGFVSLGEHIDKMPSELSGGQRRRVAIARHGRQAGLLLCDSRRRA